MKIIYYDVGTGFLADTHLYHAIGELTHTGHEVIYINPQKELGHEAPVETYAQVLLDRVREEQERGPIDLFFSMAWDRGITPEVVRDISAMGIPTVSHSSDDLSHPFRVKKITSAFDLCWSTAPESEGILKGYGAKNLVFMPFASNPYWFKPMNVPEEENICFIGSAYGARARGIACMAQANVPVAVYGASPMDIGQHKGNPITRGIGNMADGWERFAKSLAVPGGRKCVYAALKRTAEGFVSEPPEKRPMDGTVEYRGSADFKEMVEIFSKSALSFGSIEVASTFVLKDPLLFIRFREFEVAMSGGVHLVNRYPELEGYFEEGKEMLYYDSMEELIDKSKFYLSPKRATERQKIREAAHKRAVANHTWSHRFDRVCRELGLKFQPST